MVSFGTFPVILFDDNFSIQVYCQINPTFIWSVPTDIKTSSVLLRPQIFKELNGLYESSNYSQNGSCVTNFENLIGNFEVEKETLN